MEIVCYLGSGGGYTSVYICQRSNCTLQIGTLVACKFYLNKSELTPDWQLPTNELDPRMGKWDEHVLILSSIKQGWSFSNTTHSLENHQALLCSRRSNADSKGVLAVWTCSFSCCLSEAAAGYTFTKLQVASIGRTASSLGFMNSVHPRAQSRGGLWKGEKTILAKDANLSGPPKTLPSNKRMFGMDSLMFHYQECS